MLCPPPPESRLVQNWLERHQGTLSFVLHLVGIPISVLGLLVLPVALASWSQSVAVVAVALFVGGYALQFLGHGLEGSDPGEIIALKRKLGLSYVEIAPRRASPRAGA
jgi:uncharacterized membrane protein YGL010W